MCSLPRASESEAKGTWDFSWGPLKSSDHFLLVDSRLRIFTVDLLNCLRLTTQQVAVGFLNLNFADDTDNWHIITHSKILKNMLTLCEMNMLLSLRFHLQWFSCFSRRHYFRRWNIQHNFTKTNTHALNPLFEFF